MSDRSGTGGDRSRLEDALVFQIDERDIELMAEEEEADERFARRFSQDLNEASGLWRQDGSVVAPGDPFARINEMQSLMAVLRACLPESKSLLELENELTAAAGQAATLVSEGAAFSQFDPRAKELDMAVARVEHGLIEAERKMPLSWLRHRMDELDFGDVALAHYLGFLIRHLKIAPTSISRVDLVVTRLASQRRGDGSLELRSPVEVAQLISACVPASTTSAYVRNNAILFFRNAAERMADMAHVEEFFESGLHVDVLGYKLSLRHEYLDPRLLYAAAELDIAMENWVRELGMSMRVLDPYFAQGREKVRKILNRSATGVDAMTERWNREYSGEIRLPGTPVRRAGTSGMAAAGKKGRGSGTSARPQGTGPASWRKLVAAGVILVAVIYIAPTLLDFFREEQRGLVSLSTSETMDIDPLLVEGSWAGEPPYRVFVGYVDPEGWRALRDDERRRTAQSIRERLGFRDVNGALVYMRLGRDETLVMNIMEGEVRYVQPPRE